jgi:DNA-directed RNA polymerase specialized sigma24 family protein
MTAAYLPLPYRRAVEQMLTEYPIIKAELRRLDRWFEEISAPCLIWGERVDGGVAVAIQERVRAIKENDADYRDLSTKVDAVEQALRDLPEDYKRFIALKYWEGQTAEEICEAFGWKDPRVVWRIRTRVVVRCAPSLIGAWGKASD